MFHLLQFAVHELFRGYAQRSGGEVRAQSVKQWSLSELTVELGASCNAGVLILQAMGLGGWMFNGVDPFVMLGASGNPDSPGLEFRYDEDNRWPYPNPTGLEAVMEGYCPPHYRKPPPKICNSQLGAVIFI